MNLKKINLKDATAIVGEANRSLYENRKHPPRIDKRLSYKNMTLYKDQNDQKTLEYYISHNDNRKKLRDNNVVLGCWVIQYNETIKKEDYGKFFDKGISFVKERYGNVFNAYLHLDEPNAKPHVHILFMPFEKGTHKFNAKKIMTPIECSKFHKDFGAYMSKELGYQVSMLNKETIKNEHDQALDPKSLKDRQTLIRNNIRLQKELDATKSVIEETMTILQKEAPATYKNVSTAVDNVIKKKPNLFYRVKNWFTKLFHRKKEKVIEQEIE